jgi:O-antigen/teichoic acid export membrane protein
MTTAACAPPTAERVPGWTGRVARRYPALAALATYSTATYLGQALALVRGLVVAGLLGPAGFGIWRIVKLILTYSEHLPLGAVHAMRQELPAALGGGRTREAASIIRTVFGAVGLLSLGIIAAVVLAAAVLPESRTGVPRLWALLTGLLVVAQLLQTTVNGRLQSEERVGLYSTHLLVFSTLALAGMTAGAAVGGLGGALSGLLVAYAVPLLWLASRGVFPPPALPQRRALQPLLAVGIPIWVAWFPVLLLGDVDQWLVGALLGPAALGRYAVAVFFGSLLHFLPFIYRNVYQPFLLRRLAESRDARQLAPYLTQSLLFVGYAVPIPIAALFFLADPVIRLAMPAYQSAIPAARAYFLSSFWHLSASVTFMICLALWRKRGWLLNTGAAILAHALLTAAILRMGGGLVGAACSMGVVWAGYAAAQVHLAVAALTHPGSDAWGLLGRLLVPFAGCLGVCLGVHALWPLPEAPAALVAAALGRAAVAMGLLAWLYRWADGRLKFSSVLTARVGGADTPAIGLSGPTP